MYVYNIKKSSSKKTFMRKMSFGQFVKRSTAKIKKINKSYLYCVKRYKNENADSSQKRMHRK